ncbi:MAG: hypothetical protein AAFX87_05230 [Bacteroidota bacterium]
MQSNDKSDRKIKVDQKQNEVKETIRKLKMIDADVRIGRDEDAKVSGSLSPVDDKKGMPQLDQRLLNMKRTDN